MEELFDWARANKPLMAGIAGASLVFFLGSLAAIPFLVARIPADYFARRRPPRHPWAEQHPAARLALKGVKNAIGAALLVLGVAMLVLPGQGVITLLLAITLLDFPGKRRLELFVVRQPRVLRALNWIRHRTGREPLTVWVPPARRARAREAPEGRSPAE